MDEQVQASLLQGGVIDITTTGRKTGEARRIEVRIHNVDGQLHLSGAPGKRDWYANMLADPQFKVHLKSDVFTDLEAFALPILAGSERRRVFRVLLENTGNIEQLEERLAKSALVHVSVTLE